MKNLNPAPRLDPNLNPKTTSQLKILPNQQFDFATAQDKSSSLESYSEGKKAELNHKIFNPKYAANKSSVWILLILIVCLTGLCGFTTYQIYNYEKDLQSKTSRGDIKDLKIIAGDGFSFIIDPVIPNGFYKESTRSDFEWLEGKKANVNSFLSKDTIDGEENINGVAVYSTEYDGKLSQKEFAQKVADKLGDTFKLDASEVSLASGSLLSHHSPVNPRIKINYFTAVNSNNYFVIKVYNQGKDSPKASDKAEFTKGLLSNLRLN
jgi:hypothetical protein